MGTTVSDRAGETRKGSTAHEGTAGVFTITGETCCLPVLLLSAPRCHSSLFGVVANTESTSMVCCL